jgi:hypothetical protein
MPALQTAEIVRISQHFTDAYVRRLRLAAGENDRIVWDPEMPGFGVRLRSTKAVYIVQYRFQKATQRESLGDVRKLNLAARSRGSFSRSSSLAWTPGTRSGRPRPAPRPLG